MKREKKNNTRLLYGKQPFSCQATKFHLISLVLRDPNRD